MTALVIDKKSAPSDTDVPTKAPSCGVADISRVVL